MFLGSFWFGFFFFVKIFFQVSGKMNGQLEVRYLALFRKIEEKPLAYIVKYLTFCKYISTYEPIEKKKKLVSLRTF